MQDPVRAYKYSCRDCTIRQRCIDEKSYGPGLKKEIARRFWNRTDTFETWDLLQQDCLLIRAEDEPSHIPHRESSLIKRLRESRHARQQITEVEPESADSWADAIQITPLPAPPARQEPPPAPQPPADTVAQDTELPCGIIVAATGRLVRLPDQGDIVFGRFERGFSSPPDIDLTFEDGEIPSVSRRHGLVISRRGQHWIEDMGSSNGTYINGHPVPLGKTVQLSAGDRILMGRCRLLYDTLPDWASDPNPRRAHAVKLLVTHTGHRIELPDKNQMMVGRPDPALGYIPDVDISVAGDIAMYVSRRHAKIITRGGWHFLEEMGSAAGTRLNGRPILLGEAPEMLRPGDHIWLGGCVLAYEWQFI